MNTNVKRLSATGAACAALALASGLVIAQTTTPGTGTAPSMPPASAPGATDSGTPATPGATGNTGTPGTTTTPAAPPNTDTPSTTPRADRADRN